MREKLFHDLSSFVNRSPNAKYKSEKRRGTLNLTSLQDYISYMKNLKKKESLV